MKKILLFLAIVGIVACTSGGGGNPPSPTPPPPVPDNLTLNGKYVLSGNFGAITNKTIAAYSQNLQTDNSWKQMPLGTTSINNYVYARNRFVAAGGKVMTDYLGNTKPGLASIFSDDGINWYSSTSVFQPFMISGNTSTVQSQAVTQCFNNSFVGSTGGPSIGNIYFDSQTNKFIMPCANSNDGINWTYINNHTGVPYIYGNSRYLTTATAGYYDFPNNAGYYSLDGGLSWLSMTTSPFSLCNGCSGTNNNFGIYFNGSQFISGALSRGFDMSGSESYQYSSDGTNWVANPAPIVVPQISQPLSNKLGCVIASGNNKFFCGFNLGDNVLGNYALESLMYVATSTNGINNWQITPITTNGESVNYGTMLYVNNTYFADCSPLPDMYTTLPNYRVCSSNDGINWAFHANSPARISYRGYVGTDALNTGLMYINFNEGMRTLTYVMGKYYLFGDNGKIWYSSDDMQTWTQTASGITVSNYNTFKTTTGLSFVLGVTKSGYYADNTVKMLSIAYSTDNAASFKMASVPALNQTPLAVATSGSDYVVVGTAATLLHSLDGMTWTKIDVSSITTADLTNVEYLNGKYYVTGDLGYVLTSNNGTTWTSSQVSANPRLMDIIYSNNKYLVVGYGGYIGYSANATNWIRATTNTSSQINSIIYGNSIYVAVGTNGTVISSSDGITWSAVPASNFKYSNGAVANISSTTLNSILYDNLDGFVIVGDNGIVMKSSDGNNWNVDAPSTYNYTGITQVN